MRIFKALAILFIVVSSYSTLAYEMIELPSSHAFIKKNKINKMGSFEAGFAFSELQQERVAMQLQLNYFVFNNWHMGFQPMLDVISADSGHAYDFAPAIRLGHTWVLLRNLEFSLSHLLGSYFLAGEAPDTSFKKNEVLMAIMPSLNLNLGKYILSISYFYRYNIEETAQVSENALAFTRPKTRVYAGLSWQLY